MGAGKERAGRRAPDPPRAWTRPSSSSTSSPPPSRRSSPPACWSTRRTTRSSTSWTCSARSSPSSSRPRTRARPRPPAAACCAARSGPEEIAEVVSAWTGIPVSRMMETERAKLLVMEERIHQRLVGQDEAVRGRGQRRPPQPLRPGRPAIAPSARSSSSGPTGVGKTELARPWPR